MKNSVKLLSLILTFVVSAAFAPRFGKLVSNTGHINFFSHTAAEDISSDNFKVTSTLDTETGEVVFSVPMQSFEFEKALMQKHFNSNNFLNTKKYPKAKFVGKISNVSAVNFDKDGVYEANVEGNLTIKAVTNAFSNSGTVTIKGNEVSIDTKFDVILKDFEIAFEEGKPSTNVAKVVEVTVKTIYKK
ncbi:MAG: YceI family protein [Imperialibacter sp.]|uniref:YceI family protein n=1 Tax=Imperialibacter sp. TaxID=2038411 RepID=UPI003A8800D9